MDGEKIGQAVANEDTVSFTHIFGHPGTHIGEVRLTSDRLPLDDVLDTLRTRPKDVHVVLTGRRCPPEIIELADTVTEMTKIKHAFNAGIPAQRGIED